MTASSVREFAIRVALGAAPGEMMRLVLGRGTHLALVGLGLGLFGALAMVPLLDELPVRVRPPDAMTMVPIALLLIAVALAASLVPALRVAKIDPAVTLRSD